MKKVCVVTGTRAEYGLLKPIIKKIQEDDQLELFLVVTGMHLSPEFGLTYREIEKDGFPIAAKNEMILSADTPSSIVKSMGVAMIGFADIFSDKKIDIIILLGDRYEIFAAASAALVNRIPIAHIHGGELTEGAIDDALRHSITKMSALHFTSTEEYRKRVIQMGEQPKYVHCVGALGVENIKSIKLLNRIDLEKEIGYVFSNRTVMVTYHPVTLEENTSMLQMKNLLNALDKIDLNIIFTKANSDTDGRIINEMIDEYVKKHQDRSVAYTSMGQLRYLSALQNCIAVVGNSSSGLIEAPSFGIPTINIGNRQKGRIIADSIINCGTNIEDIEYALEKALSEEFRDYCKLVINPYEKEGSSRQIIDILKEFVLESCSDNKKFYDLDLSICKGV